MQDGPREYRFNVKIAPRSDGKWEAWVPQFPGCEVVAGSKEAANEAATAAVRQWLEDYKSVNGRPNVDQSPYKL